MYQNFFKRIIDIIFSIIGMILLIVITIMIAPIIYIEDKGPIFYNGLRLGKKGKIFKMYKFRTMKVNAEDIRNKDGSTYNGSNDPRLTKIGKFLRKTSIDELPQFINVLIGNMSIIGPRPDLPEHIKKYTKEERKKLNVLPGITGYNQAYYRNSITWKERLKNDIYYVNNISLILDIKIFFKTIKTVLFREKIYISNNKYEIKDLAWDTNYFGMKSGKVNLYQEINKKDLKAIKKEIKKYKFTTISNFNNNNINNILLGKLNGFIADVNVQFTKQVQQVNLENNNIYIKEKYKGNKNLLTIAKKAYKYSRFLNDKNLDRKKSKLLYYNWLKNSFNKDGKFITYYKDEKDYLGYCLFHIEENNTCVIELIAVDKNNTKRGIGTLLIQSVEQYCYKNEINKIEVGTQLENIKAQNFYIKNGFKIETYNPTYHIWR